MKHAVLASLVAGAITACAVIGVNIGWTSIVGSGISSALRFLLTIIPGLNQMRDAISALHAGQPAAAALSLLKATGYVLASILAAVAVWSFPDLTRALHRSIKKTHRRRKQRSRA